MYVHEFPESMFLSLLPLPKVVGTAGPYAPAVAMHLAFHELPFINANWSQLKSAESVALTLLHLALIIFESEHWRKYLIVLQ